MNAGALYARRVQRVLDAVELRRPDRVPTIFYTMFWHARRGDFSCRDAMYDYGRVNDITRRLVLEFEPDMYALPHPMTAFGPIMDRLGFRQMQWPGHGTAENVSFQYLDRGLIPMVLWEGDCTSRLETIAEIPPGKAVYWFERTDLVRAKEVLGNTVCLRGNVPASMLTTGTPQQVDACCRTLIAKVGRDGGFILDGAIGIPDEARPENVAALFESVRKYAP